MFENDDDIVVDDEFLNIVFESEEIDNNNKLLNDKLLVTGKLSTDVPVELSTPSAIRKCITNTKDQFDTNESFHARHNLPSRSTEKHFPQFSHVNNSHQQGTSFALVWNHTFTGQSDIKRNQSLGNNNVGDKENKRKASPPPSRSKRERRFPGPAGLLPDRKSCRGTPLKPDSVPEVESPSASSPEDLCSQGRLSGSVLEEGPWQSLVSDLGPHADVLDVVNVASVKRKAAARCFVGRKVPLLAAALHHLDVSSADPCIILRDSTGEIHGTLHREVWQQFAAELVVGSVLIIRNVGLLSTGLSSRRHYLNITANNLATIYSANPDKPQKRELHSLTTHDFKRTIEQWQSLMAAPRTVVSPALSLFNTSLPPSSPAHSPQMLGVHPRFNGPIHTGIPHASNIRPTTSQYTQVHGSLTGTPPCPRANPPLRPTGKNLFPSCSNSNNHIPVQTLNSNTISPSASRQNGGIVYKANPNVGRDTFSNSFLSHSVQKPYARNIQNEQMSRNSAPSFKFDPVMLKTKTSCGAVYPPNNLFKQSISRNEFGKDCETSFGNNSSRITLSQSSQLTAEEQSVVDSVFDGIDADSLFDDDDF